MLKNLKLFTLSMFSLLIFQSVGAQDAAQITSGATIKFLGDLGIEYGGDDLIEIQFVGGGDQTMKAGQGGYIAAGAEIDLGESTPIMFRATIGLKYNTTAAENANIRLTRYPVNVLGYYKIDNDIRIGAGITTHLGPSFKGDGFFVDDTYTSSVGPRIEIGWKALALTYSSVKYENSANQEIDASNIGLSVSFTLPN